MGDVGGVWAAKAAVVADSTVAGSFLRICAGRKGREVPWVLCFRKGWD